MQGPLLRLDRRQPLRIDLRIDAGDDAEPVPVPLRREDDLPAAQGAEANPAVGERHLRQELDDQAALGGIALHKLETGGRVIKEIRDDDRRTVRTAGLFPCHHVALIEEEPEAGLAPAAFRQQLDPAHRRDGGQRLPAKSQRLDGREVRLGADLARRMAQKGRLRLLRRDAAAVVRHADIGLPALSDLHEDGGGAGVDGVLDQLLDDGNRPVHHLSGGDPVGHLFFQHLNHRWTPSVPPVSVWPAKG